MTLVYVFDPRTPTGYLFRAPAILARAWTRWVPGCWDYAASLEGACRTCSARIWGSGFAVGAHRRKCARREAQP
jgi:hypothetical protein